MTDIQIIFVSDAITNDFVLILLTICRKLFAPSYIAFYFKYIRLHRYASAVMRETECLFIIEVQWKRGYTDGRIAKAMLSLSQIEAWPIKEPVDYRGKPMAAWMNDGCLLLGVAGNATMFHLGATLAVVM